MSVIERCARAICFIDHFYNTDEIPERLFPMTASSINEYLDLHWRDYQWMAKACLQALIDSEWPNNYRIYDEENIEISKIMLKRILSQPSSQEEL